MKKIFTLTLLFAFQLVVLAQADATNDLITNPGFEDGANSNWTLEINAGEGTLSDAGSSEAASGSEAAKVQVTNSLGIWEMWLQGTVADASSYAGKELDISFAAKKVSASANIQKIMLRIEANGSNISGFATECWYGAEDVYETFTRTVTVPIGTTQLQIKVWCGQQNGDLFFDDFKVVDVNAPLSVSKKAITAVKMYPNPTNGILNFKGVEEIQNIEMIDIAGKVISAVNNQNFINIESLAPGIYIARIALANNESVFQKVIKN